MQLPPWALQAFPQPSPEEVGVLNASAGEPKPGSHLSGVDPFTAMMGMAYAERERRRDEEVRRRCLPDTNNANANTKTAA